MSQNVIPPTVIFNGVSMATNQTSTPVHILYSDNVSIQLVWTGTPNGTFGIEVSNTAVLNPDGTVSGGTWDSLGLSPAVTASGSSGHTTIDLNQLGSAFVRAKYTASSSTGTLTGTLVAKPV